MRYKHIMRSAFSIDHIPIYGQLILAPMDGFSDVPYRSICRNFGSAISYTAFISAIEINENFPKIAEAFTYLPEERPVIFQIFDSSVERLLTAALKIEELEPDAIDINMGCSVRRVSGRGAGAGLLRDPIKIAKIMRLLSQHLQVPTTAKIRLGWDEDSLNYLEIAKAIEDNGGSLIAVHARTKAQGYGGTADWDAIGAIKNHVDIPVIGNGDVQTIEDIDRMLEQTQCDGIMIGRAAIGNPWIFRRQSNEDIDETEYKDVVCDHLERMLAHYGQERGVILFRKHLARYIRPFEPPNSLRHDLLTSSDATKVTQLIEELLCVEPTTNISMIY